MFFKTTMSEETMRDHSDLRKNDESLKLSMEHLWDPFQNPRTYPEWNLPISLQVKDEHKRPVIHKEG
jgi:hypothetical protein